MKKTLSIILSMAMLMGVMVFPVNVSAENTATTPYVYYPEGYAQQKIYLTPNAAGNAYEIDYSKHPQDVKVYVGDEIIITEPLNITQSQIDKGYSADRPEELLDSYAWAVYYATSYKADGSYTSSERKSYRAVDFHRTISLVLHPPTASAGHAFVVTDYSKVIINLPIEKRDSSFSNKNANLNYIDFTTENTKTIGRRQSGNPFKLYLHNTGVEFKFTGSTIGFVSEGPSQGFVYCIDGVDGYVYTFPGKFTYILADNLDPNKEHTVKIVRSEEAYTEAVTLISAVTDAEEIYATEETEYKIQFIGDSISSGAAMPDYSQSYVYMTGKKLGWDTEVYSMSGMTMSDMQFDDGTMRGHSMAYIYGGVYPQINQNGYYTINQEKPHLSTFTADSSKGQKTIGGGGKYDFSFQPDVVVINLGGNDLAGFSYAKAGETNKKNFVHYYVDFMEWLTELYGDDVQFICAYGMMEGVGKEISPLALSLIKEAVDTFNAKIGKNNAHQLVFDAQVDYAVYSEDGGKKNNYHPGPQTNINASENLVEFIQKELQMGDTIVAEPEEDGTLELPTPTRENNLFLGWCDEDGNLVTENTTFEAGQEVKLSAQWVDATELLSGTIDADGNANDDNPVDKDATYTNGLYIQGAQVRTPLDEKSANVLGLRFVTVVNEDLIKFLKNTNGIKDVTFGTLVASTSKVGGKVLVKGMDGVSEVEATKIWRNSQTLNANYEKFTACVTNIPEKHLTTNVCIRPYICYTNASGTVTYIYGDQYSGASIYTIAKAAYDSGEETPEINNYLYENIIKLATGDNDTTLPF